MPLAFTLNVPVVARPASRCTSTLRRKRDAVRYRRRAAPVACIISAPETNVVSTDTALPATADVVVIGAGPAGLSLARALGERGVSVVCVDPALSKQWPNNYGTWLDELEPLGLAHCAANVWNRTAVHTSPRKTVLTRPYVRVDRVKLKRTLLEQCAKHGIAVREARAEGVDVEHAQHSVVCTDIGAVEARIVVDATGHALRFVRLADGSPPGFQAAYGIECEVEDELGFNGDEMMLMDFRDEHLSDKAASETQPTFLYVMPLGGKRVFYEETSLVANPAMDFGLLKERLYIRLRHHGVKVKRVFDEENCLIPMGGALPDAGQRVVAYGGAAAFVHPATGYMIARALTLANTTADGIVDALGRGGNANEMAMNVWRSTWNERMLSQRDFLNYGGSYLQKIGLQKTRDFFDAFFKLPQEQWGGFLSFKLEEPEERLLFGLRMFALTTNRVRLSLMRDSVMEGGWPFFASLLPLVVARPRMPGMEANE